MGMACKMRILMDLILEIYTHYSNRFEGSCY